MVGRVEGKTIFGLNTVISTMVKLQSINDVDIPSRASNHLRVDSIRLVCVYVCGDTHDEIMETIFQGRNYIMMD